MTFKAIGLDKITIKGGVYTDVRGNAYSAGNTLSFYCGPVPELGARYRVVYPSAPDALLHI